MALFEPLNLPWDHCSEGKSLHTHKLMIDRSFEFVNIFYCRLPIIRLLIN